MLKSGPVRALGAMSGTSLDGVDAAVVVTDGHEILDFGETGYRPYREEERSVLRAALGAWPGDAGVTAAAEIVEAAHRDVLGRFGAVDLVGFHGQTLSHEPGGRGTHQAGDGRKLAHALGRPVVWDFRSSDVRLGGQGAPLAPFYHFALARRIGADAPVAFLNLGGVANLTWVDPSRPRPESEGACLAFDTGPANAPIDDFVRARTGAAFDEDGALALSGQPDEEVVAAYLKSDWFRRMPPKSLDRGAFAALGRAIGDMAVADGAATLAACAAAAVAAGLELCPGPPARVIVCGGGRLNGATMVQLARRLPCPVALAEDHGLDGDMIEAQAFAHLAVRVARGLPTSCPGTTGVAAAVGGGTISRPG